MSKDLSIAKCEQQQQQQKYRTKTINKERKMQTSILFLSLLCSYILTNIGGDFEIS